MTKQDFTVYEISTGKIIASGRAENAEEQSGVGQAVLLGVAYDPARFKLSTTTLLPLPLPPPIIKPPPPPFTIPDLPSMAKAERRTWYTENVQKQAHRDELFKYLLEQL